MGVVCSDVGDGGLGYDGGGVSSVVASEAVLPRAREEVREEPDLRWKGRRKRWRLEGCFSPWCPSVWSGTERSELCRADQFAGSGDAETLEG